MVRLLIKAEGGECVPDAKRQRERVNRKIKELYSNEIIERNVYFGYPPNSKNIHKLTNTSNVLLFFKMLIQKLRKILRIQVHIIKVKFWQI